MTEEQRRAWKHLRGQVTGSFWWIWCALVAFVCTFTKDEDWWESERGQEVCERTGHDDVWFMNPGGFEPDMHCRRCGKDIG